MTTKFAGQGAVVTGAGGGIGRALALRLAAGGVRVVVNDLDGDAAAAVAAEVGGVSVAGDVAAPAGVAELVERSREELGAIDLWFGNAGIDRGRGLESTDGDWATSLEVNVLAHVRAARLLIPDWIERGSGRFVVTASAAGLLTMLGSPAYTASKHGAVGFAEWLSATYRHRGVIVQATCPQGVQTRLLEESGSLKRLLSHDGVLAPDEIAEAMWEALEGDRFLVLPHARVARYVAQKAADLDLWLEGMNRIQRSLDAASYADDALRKSNVEAGDGLGLVDPVRGEPAHEVERQ